MNIIQHIKDVIAVNKMEKIQFGAKFVGTKEDIDRLRKIIKCKEITDRFYMVEISKDIYDNLKCNKYKYVRK